MWGDGGNEAIALGSWTCRDWVNRTAHDTGDPLVANHPRKFGIVLADHYVYHDMAKYLHQELRRCGLNPHEYTYALDVSRAEAEAQTVISRMRADGITTILGLHDFLSNLFLDQAADSQNYHPEWVKSGWSDGGSPIEYRTFSTPSQAVNTWAAAD